MGASLAIHVVTRAELQSGGAASAWDDPHGLARLTPQKRAAILENPFGGDEDSPAQIVATVAETVVGHMELLPGRFVVRGETAPCLWGSDVLVLDEFRGTLAGPRMIMKHQSLCETAASCGVSSRAFPVYRQLKWRTFEMPRYVFLQRSRAVVERYVGPGIGGRVAAGAADLALAAQRGFLWGARRARCASLSVEEVESMPPELDELREDGEREAVIPRTVAWVNWALRHSFSEDESLRKALFIVRDRRSRVVGYYLVKSRLYETASRWGYRGLRLGTLSDWAIYDARALSFQRLVLLALRTLSRFEVDAVEVCLPAEYDGKKLVALGAKRVGAQLLMIKAGPDSPLTAPVFGRPEAWRIRPAAGDTVFS